MGIHPCHSLQLILLFFIFMLALFPPCLQVPRFVNGFDEKWTEKSFLTAPSVFLNEARALQGN